MRNQAGHDWALEDLIDSADHQLLIATPTLSYQRLHAVLPNLRKAVERDVRIIIMWGRTADDRLAPKVQSALDELILMPEARISFRAAVHGRTPASWSRTINAR